MQVSPAVSCKPPLLPLGRHALWSWLWATLTVSDSDLLASCGLDALMFVKMYTLGRWHSHFHIISDALSKLLIILWTLGR